MHFFLNSKYPFMKWRKTGYVVSLVLLGIAILGLIIKGGPKWSVDFTGGTLVQVHVEPDTEIAKLRASLEEIGLATSEIQRFGESNEYLIRADRSRYDQQTSDKIIEALRGGLPGSTVEVRRTEDVGPKVGAELKWGAAKALALGLLCILMYVGVRYEFRFAAAAVMVLFYDVIVVTGLLTLLGREFSLNVVAALLTIAGYSVNDTIIVFDRIREDMRLYRRDAFEKIVELSINQTLSRTIITSGLTFSSVVVLYLFGGEVIRDFALALGIGIAIGTLDSIFIAASIVVDWRGRALAAAERKRTRTSTAAA